MFDELRRLAEAATPGPWHAESWHVHTWDEETQRFGALLNVAKCGGAVNHSNPIGQRVLVSDALEGNAAFIAAANPAAILALLDRLAAAERVVEAGREMDRVISECRAVNKWVGPIALLNSQREFREACERMGEPQP